MPPSGTLGLPTSLPHHLCFVVTKWLPLLQALRPRFKEEERTGEGGMVPGPGKSEFLQKPQPISASVLFATRVLWPPLASRRSEKVSTSG